MIPLRGAGVLNNELVSKPRPMDGERLPGSIPMTALAVTNAIPAVVAAQPGHLSPIDLPHYTTRRAAPR